MATIAERILDAKGRDLLTVEQFALLVQYQPKSIYRMIDRGDLPFVRVGRRGILIRIELVEKVRQRHPNPDRLLSL